MSKKGGLRLNSMADFEELRNRGKVAIKNDRPRPRHVPGKMNKSEEAYARQLEAVNYHPLKQVACK